MKLSSEQFQFHDEIKVIRKKSGSRCGMLSRKGSVEIFFFLLGNGKVMDGGPVVGAIS